MTSKKTVTYTRGDDRFVWSLEGGSVVVDVFHGSDKHPLAGWGFPKLKRSLAENADVFQEQAELNLAAERADEGL